MACQSPFEHPYVKTVQDGRCSFEPKADAELQRQDAPNNVRRGGQENARNSLSNLQSKRWSDAGRKVTTLLSLSRGFKTLRDQYAENTILPEELQTIKSLGQGAFAKVELCHYCPQKQRSLDPQDAKPPCRVVAVKSLKPGAIGSSPDELNALLKEVALMRKLKHKHIVSYIGMGNHGNEAKSTFLVEEALPGGSAKRLIVRQLRQLGTRMYNYTDALRWSCQVADGMAYLHSCRPQVIHRDLKLENILLKGETVSTSIAKLTDFGLSALVKKKMLGEIALASRRSVEANNLAVESSKASARRSRPSSASSMAGRRANRRRRAATARKGSMPSIMSDSDPAVLQARWNVNFEALSRKVQLAEQHHAIARAQSRLSCDFHLEPQDMLGHPWHTGHPNISQPGHASATSSIVSSTAGSHGGAAFSRIQTFSTQALDADSDNRESTGKPINLVMLEEGSSARTSRPSPSTANDAGPQSSSSAQQPEKSGGPPIIREASLQPIIREASLQGPSPRRASQIPHLPIIVATINNRARHTSPGTEASQRHPGSMETVGHSGPQLLHMESVRHEDHEPLHPNAGPHIIRRRKSIEEQRRQGTSTGPHSVQQLDSLPLQATNLHSSLQHIESVRNEDHEPLHTNTGPHIMHLGEAVGHEDHEQPQGTSTGPPSLQQLDSIHEDSNEALPATSLHPSGSLQHMESLQHEDHKPLRTFARPHTLPRMETVGQEDPEPVHSKTRPHTSHHVKVLSHDNHEPLRTSVQPQAFQHSESAWREEHEPQRTSGGPHTLHDMEAVGHEDQEPQRTSMQPPVFQHVDSVQHKDSEPLRTSARPQLHTQPEMLTVGHEDQEPLRTSAQPHTVHQMEVVGHEDHEPQRTNARPHSSHHVESVGCGEQEPLFAASAWPRAVEHSQCLSAGHTLQEPVRSSHTCPDHPTEQQQQLSHHDHVVVGQYQHLQHLHHHQPVSLPPSMAGSGYLLEDPLLHPSGRKTVDCPTRSPSNLHVRVDSLPRTAVVSRAPSFSEVQRNSQGLLGVDVPGAVLTTSNDGMPKCQAHTVISRSREVPTVTGPDTEVSLDPQRCPSRRAERGANANSSSHNQSPPASASNLHKLPHDGGVLHPPFPAPSTANCTGGILSDGAPEAAQPLHNGKIGSLSDTHGKQPIPANRQGPQHLPSRQSDQFPSALSGQPPSSCKDHGRRGDAPDPDKWGVKGSQGKKEGRSLGGSQRTKKPSGAAVRADKKKQKLATELRQVVDEHVQLSGRIGTLLYMSPEVYRSEYYDEKSDVFSFGVIMYELFHRFLVVFAAAPSGNQSEVEQYAEQVSQGYRPPLGSHIPFSLGSLIRDCGAQNPKERPTMAVVVERLRAIEAEGVVAKMDELPEIVEEGCSCANCSVM